MLIVQNSSITILVNKIFYQIKRKYKKSFSTCVVIIKTFKTGRNTLALESQLTLLYQITTKQNFDHTRMSSLSSFLGTYINKATVNLDASKSPHHKKDVILRFLRLSVFTILIYFKFTSHQWRSSSVSDFQSKARGFESLFAVSLKRMLIRNLIARRLVNDKTGVEQ